MSTGTRTYLQHDINIGYAYTQRIASQESTYYTVNTTCDAGTDAVISFRSGSRDQISLLKTLHHSKELKKPDSGSLREYIVHDCLKADTTCLHMPWRPPRAVSWPGEVVQGQCWSGPATWALGTKV